MRCVAHDHGQRLLDFMLYGPHVRGMEGGVVIEQVDQVEMTLMVLRNHPQHAHCVFPSRLTK